MPSLRELQAAMRRSILERDDGAAAALVVPDGIAPEARLAVYRNTFETGLIKALRLTYPAVDRLVGGEFFDGAAMAFVHRHPPRCGYLDAYGGELAAFLEGFAPAAPLPYLPDVARLEWAVSQAIHAPDADPLTAAALAGLDPADHEHIRFAPHPSLGLVGAVAPADTIWRAVLEDDDAALAALDLASGPVALLVQRRDLGFEVSRCAPAELGFIADLAVGLRLGAAIAAHPEADAPAVLADLLANGRLAGFDIAPPSQETPP